MKNLLFTIIAASVAFVGCNKENVAGKHGNRYDMLISKKWYIESIEQNNMPYTIQSCETDNYYVFTYEDEGRWEEGANNCYANGTGTPYNDTTNGGNNNTNDTTTNKSSNDQIKTFTSFKWEMPGDQREVHIWDFGYKGARREWKIENMDFTHLDVRCVEQYNGKLYVYNIHLTGK